MPNGNATLAALESVHGSLPLTAEVATGGGGRHLYFRTPRGLRSTVLGPGLDLKAEGGYVVAPPSSHLKGSYVWTQELPANLDDLPELPHWARGAEKCSETSPLPDRRRTPRARRNSSRVPDWLPEYVPVGSRHQYLQRLAGWLRGIDHDENEILKLLHVIRDQRFEQPAHDAISDEWLAGLARAMASKPAGGAGASLYQRWENASLKWKGRTKRRDRKVLLQAILPMALRRGQHRLRLPVRTVALLARVGLASAGRALKSLVARRVLVQLQVADRDRATAYFLNAPPHLSHRDTEHDLDAPPRSYIRSVSLRDREAFRWTALGWAAEPIYEALSRRKSHSVAKLHATTGVPRSTLYRVLPRLQNDSLAIRGKHGWRRGTGSLIKAAERHGVSDQYDRERARYHAERLQYRSDAGHRHRQLLHDRRLALITQVLALAEGHGFPRLERIQDGKDPWARLVQKARAKTLRRVLALLGQRRHPGRDRNRGVRKAAASRVKL